jgi:hypothetical protein
MTTENKATLFLPSKNSWHFLNDFKFNVKLLGFLIWGAVYFCGGMCRSAIKRYIKNITIPNDIIPPQQNSALYKEIFNNQIKLTLANIFKIYAWQTYPSQNNLLRTYTIGQKTKQEWHKIRDSIKSRKPILMCIIRSQGYNPISLFHNHWVIGWRYSYDVDKKIACIWVYDPNFPDSDDGYIRFNFAISNIEPWYSRGDKVRGFFVERV